MKNLKLQIKILILFITVFAFLYFGFCSAAILYIEPDQGQYYPGDSFIVNLRVEPENECINTVKGELNFTQDVLEAIDFSQGNSILSLWVEPPKIDQKNGIISFIGGIPGGYCGKMPGDTGENNLVGKVFFQVKNQKLGPASVGFSNNSQVLLNDGLGTSAKLTFKIALFDIITGSTGEPKAEWQQELKNDTVPPEPFEIEITKDPAIFGGKYFLSFSTTDKQSGIDYYEIKEGNRNWRRGESPYLLEDQSLTSIIKVKTVDKAGNERVVEKPALRKAIPVWLKVLVLVFIVILLFRLIIIRFLERKIKKEKIK